MEVVKEDQINEDKLEIKLEVLNNENETLMQLIRCPLEPRKGKDDLKKLIGDDTESSLEEYLPTACRFSRKDEEGNWLLRTIVIITLEQPSTTSGGGERSGTRNR